LKHADKHSVITTKNIKKESFDKLIKLKKDWFAYPQFDKGVNPFEVHWIRSDSIKLISITNLFKNKLRMSGYVLYSGDKKVCGLPDVYLEAGETLFLTDDVSEQLSDYNDNKTKFLFKCKKIRKAVNAPLNIRIANEKKN